MKIKLQSSRGVRAPLTDSTRQLALLGVRPVNEFWPNTFESDSWRIERVADQDYPWLMTRREDGAKRKCSALIECVMIVQEPEKGWGFEICVG